jgi:hypothetical protein
MGNSAWRLELFRKLGPLHTFGGRRIGGEDLEFAVRATRAGWKGVYVPEAEVAHDFSELSLGRILQKQRQYSEGGYRVWRDFVATSEATGLRLLPYALIPILALLGGVLLLAPLVRPIGLGILIAAAIGFGVLALGLTIHGRSQDHRYPGLRFEVLEIFRRWSTLYGALRGALRRERVGYGRSLAPADKS